MGKPAVKSKRMVYLDHAVDATLTPIRKELTDLFAKDEAEPILLVISSFGGSGAGMFALMDRIANLRASGAKIHGLVEGYAMSAGLILLQGTEHRMMGANATLMAHGVTARISGDLTELQTELSELHLDTKRIARIFGKRTHKPASYWRKRFDSNQPLYYRAKDALQIGLVDQIVGS